MTATIFSLLQLLTLPVPADTASGTTVARADTIAAAATAARRVTAPPDTVAAGTAAAPVRVVRQFPAIEVRALLHDLRSSQTVHEIPAAALRAYLVDDLAAVVALQAGVVVQGDELHVRGGRAGETLVSLDGLTLNEPLRHRPMELPLLALRGAELVSGAPESRYVGALAGVLDLHTVDPSDRISGAWRWQSDGGLDTRFDRVSARMSAPLHVRGLGVVVAGDATLDDTALPALRTNGRRRVLGRSFGWRAENRLLGYLKLAPIARPQMVAAQVLASRRVHEPYDPAWTLDGWTGFDAYGGPIFSPVEASGLTHYHAADHLPTTDDRRVASLLTASVLRGTRRGTLALGWLRTRTFAGVGGAHAIPAAPPGVFYDLDPAGDPFHVIGGDFPLYRVSGSDVVSLRGDVETAHRSGGAIRFGAGFTYESVWLDELDATVHSRPGVPADSFRTYHAFAPGGFAYGQGRWQSGGLVLNAGLRAQYHSAGPQAEHQTLPGARGRLSLLPRLGIAYPLSARDVFSMAYVRVDQAPERDLLYDRRTAISNRQPLGNPALPPATMISYEAALKHVLGATWALQSSFFYRDVAHMAGARDYRTPGGAIDPRYTDEDQASAAGFELSLIHAAHEQRRLEARYTFMHAWGYESRPEGDPYGPLRDVSTAPFGERPLSWDRRHSLVCSGLWSWRKRWSLAWSSTVGSPLPWTPKPRREQLADLTLVNSRRFGWTETTHLNASWSPPYALGLTLGLEVRNLFDDRSELAAAVDGYPNRVINTIYDDYGAYRTETGLAGGAYWTNGSGTPGWVPVHDARLFHPPRAVRMSVGRAW